MYEDEIRHDARRARDAAYVAGTKWADTPSAQVNGVAGLHSYDPSYAVEQSKPDPNNITPLLALAGPFARCHGARANFRTVQAYERRQPVQFSNLAPVEATVRAEASVRAGEIPVEIDNSLADGVIVLVIRG